MFESFHQLFQFVALFGALYSAFLLLLLFFGGTIPYRFIRSLKCFVQVVIKASMKFPRRLSSMRKISIWTSGLRRGNLPTPSMTRS